MTNKIGMKGKGVLSGVVFCLAFVSILLNINNKSLDSTSLLLITLAVLILVLPWENISFFKAAGIELALDQTQFKGALNSLKLNHSQNKLLRKKLLDLSPEIEQVKGSRILWIDEHPHAILGERRLFRALGIEVVTAQSSKIATNKLNEDNDFDLIISDAQRVSLDYLFSLKTDYKIDLEKSLVNENLRKAFEDNNITLPSQMNIIQKDSNTFSFVVIDVETKYEDIYYCIKDNGKELDIYLYNIYDGLYFILELREGELWTSNSWENEHQIIKNIPIILYSAFKEKVLVELIKSVTGGEERLLGVESVTSIDALLELAIITLSEIRSKPIEVPPSKEPTSPS